MGVSARACSFTEDEASARSAIMPPSPLLSALRMRVTYLIETTTMSDQKIAEMPPSIFSLSRGIPYLGLKVSLTA
jgi:hypothetical protein